MTQALNGELTAAAYPLANTGGCQLGPDSLAYQLDLVVGNAPALVRLYTVQDPIAGPLAGIQITDEFVLVAGSGQIVQNSYKDCIGFEARDFVSGNHATVYATLWEKGDPQPLGGASYAGTLTGGGSGPAPPVISPIPAIRMFNTNPQTITNNVQTQLTASGADNNANATQAFTTNVAGSVFNIIAAGYYAFSFDAVWNVGAEIPAVAYLVSTGFFTGNMVMPNANTYLGRTQLSGLQRIVSAGPFQVSMNIIQTSGGNQSLLEWEAVCTQLAAG